MYYGKSAIYYERRQVYLESVFGELHTRTKTGVIAINQAIDGGRRTLTGHNYYWPMGEEWCGGDWHGLMMYLMEPGKKIVFFGINIATDLYRKRMVQVHDDPAFPRGRHA